MPLPQIQQLQDVPYFPTNLLLPPAWLFGTILELTNPDICFPNRVVVSCNDYKDHMAKVRLYLGWAEGPGRGKSMNNGI